MRRNLLYKCVMVCGLLLSIASTRAQLSFDYKSSLDSILSPGFYKIVLSPAIIAKTKNDLNDIRILDEKGIQVPYILRSDKAVFEEKNFIELPILDIKREADKQTHIVIENKTGKAVSELLLVIKNTEAERTATLSGSDDRQRWFVIKEHMPLSTVSVSTKDRFIQLLNFPNSSYKFFELIINGKDLLPVNIVKVGVHEGVLLNGGFADIPRPMIIQKDSADKHSYISLVFNEHYLVNKLELDFQGARFFKRALTIRDDADYFTNDYTLGSDIEPVYNVNIKSKKIQIVVDNQDNPPLKLQSVKAFQLNKYLLAYLEPAMTYKLVYGDSTVNAPRYDLDFFKDSLNNNIKEISTGAVTESDDIKIGQKKKGIQSMMPLWVIIAVVLALMLVLTIRMTREVAGKNKVDDD